MNRDLWRDALVAGALVVGLGLFVLSPGWPTLGGLFSIVVLAGWLEFLRRDSRSVESLRAEVTALGLKVTSLGNQVGRR